MNEPVRLRRGERYEACDDAVQDALFKGQSCWGTPSADGRGKAPDSPLGERKGTFDMEDAGRNVESTFALLSQKVTKAAAARRKDRQEVIDNQENDQRDGGQGIGEP